MQPHRQFPQSVETDDDIGRVEGSRGGNDLLDDNHSIISVIESQRGKMVENESMEDAMNGSFVVECKTFGSGGENNIGVGELMMVVS